MAFALKAKNQKEIGLKKWECLNLKKQAGYFFKGNANQELPFVEFGKKVHCIYLHHFNDHRCCNVSWCKILKSQRDVDPLPITDAYRNKFRSKSCDAKLFKMVEEGMAPYLTTHALKQVYHQWHSNKNESLNRKCTAVAPKDRYFSGTMSLSDRLAYVAISDSVGYLESHRRLSTEIGFWLITPVLAEWCRRADRRMRVKYKWRRRPEVKRKRAQKIHDDMREEQLQDERARKSGITYGAGIAIDELMTEDIEFSAGLESTHKDGQPSDKMEQQFREL
jgi:hypothetical protein